MAAQSDRKARPGSRPNASTAINYGITPRLALTANLLFSLSAGLGLACDKRHNADAGSREAAEAPTRMLVATEPSRLSASLASAEVVRRRAAAAKQRHATQAETKASLSRSRLRDRIESATAAGGIQALLARVQNSRAVFIMPAIDGEAEEQLSPTAFAKRLRTKWRWLAVDIQEPKTWIREVGARTYPEGLPYRVIAADGVEYLVEDWLMRQHVELSRNVPTVAIKTDPAVPAGR